MSPSALDREQILAAAETVLKRHGPSKTNVVDVAAALGVSHALLYRHFPSKAALREAIVERWLGRTTEALEPLAQGSGPVVPLLRAWFDTLRTRKVDHYREEPELFEAYRILIAESPTVLGAHKVDLEGQVSRLLARGMDEGTLGPGDPAVLARALFQATMSYHHPSLAPTWDRPAREAEFEALWTLLVQGLLIRDPRPRESSCKEPS